MEEFDKLEASVYNEANARPANGTMQVKVGTLDRRLQTGGLESCWRS